MGARPQHDADRLGPKAALTQSGLPHFRALRVSIAWGLLTFALAVPIPSHAKVSNALVLCLKPSGGWLTPATQEKLEGLIAAIAATSGTHGPPEATISSSVEISKTGPKQLVRQDLELAVVHHLRAMNAELGSHERSPSPPFASLQDFGCKATEVAVEIEVLFKHPQY